MIEERLQELSTRFEFMPLLDYTEIRYIPNDVSHLKDAPGKLVSTKTEPSLTVAEGLGLTEGVQDEDCSFTVTTRDSRGLTTYNESDKVDVEIKSVLQPNNDIKPTVIDSKNGRYSVRYRPNAPGEFTVFVKVTGNPISASPFKLIVKSSAGNKSRSK